MISLTQGELEEIRDMAEHASRLERKEAGWAESWKALAAAAARCASLVESVVFPS